EGTEHRVAACSDPLFLLARGPAGAAVRQRDQDDGHDERKEPTIESFQHGAHGANVAMLGAGRWLRQGCFIGATRTTSSDAAWPRRRRHRFGPGALLTKLFWEWMSSGARRL